MSGKFVHSIGQICASATMALMAACDNLKRLDSFLDRKVDAFYKPKLSKMQMRPKAA